MGRPTLLTPELREQAVTVAATGAGREIIADHLGIHPATLYNWLRWGNDDFFPTEKDPGPENIEPYREFVEAVKRAQARPVLICEGIWMQAVQGRRAVLNEQGDVVEAAVEPDWKAARDWLRLHRPDLYREQIDVELDGPVAKAVEGWFDSTRAMIEAATGKASDDDAGS